MNARCRIRLLGELAVTQGDRTITHFRTRKTASLLATIAYQLDRFHPREVLAGMLWPEAGAVPARHSLCTALSSLRHQLEAPGCAAGSVLMADRFAVRLNPETVTTDVVEFEAAIAAAKRAASGAERMQYLEDAIELYRGELLPGFYESWIPGEQVLRSEQFVDALCELIVLLEKEGNLRLAVAWAQRAVAADPLREEPHRELMRLHAAMGDPHAGLRQYRELKRVFREELGEEPAAATCKLAGELESACAAARGGERAGATPVVAPRPRAPALPSGTVTLLLIDARATSEPSEEESPKAVDESLLASRRMVLRGELRRQGGKEIRETGDGPVLVAFGRAGDAVACSAACQRALRVQAPQVEEELPRARMAIHTGDVELEQGQYGGPIRDCLVRLLALAHPGQILCSEATATLLRHDLNADLALRNVGVYRLRGSGLPEELFQIDYPGMPEGVFPPPRAEFGYPSTLPAPLTRLFGREEDLKRLEEMLGSTESRLVALTGSPGSGKTRLALEAGRRLRMVLRGAVWFVPLADLRDPSRIADRCLDPLGVERREHVDPHEQLVAFLSRQPSLVVLDNFEHLLAGAKVVPALLERVPALTCLVTSRQRLGLAGEREYRVPPLATPKGTGALEVLADNASVQLFVDRAQAVRPDFQLTQSNAEAVATLCRRLEGIPLALELAAARTQVLSPAQLAARLEQGSSVLASRRRDVEERHQTLREAVAWSYDLLSPELQRFFAGLSVFRGGCTVEAAEAVCEEPLALDYMAQLVECSLVQVEPDGGGDPRFRMLEMVREYASERLAVLGEQAVVREQHLDYFLARAEESNPELRGPRQREWLDKLAADHENQLAALESCPTAPAGAQKGLRLVGALWPFWEIRDPGLGRSALAEALSCDQEGRPTPERAVALHGAGVLARSTGDYRSAHSLLAESLAASRELGDKHLAAMSLCSLGLVAQSESDYTSARSLLAEGMELSREVGDRRGVARGLLNLGLVAVLQGDGASARSWLEQSLRGYAELGDRLGRAKVLKELGTLAYDQEDYRAADSYLMETLTIARELGHRVVEADSFMELGLVALAQGDCRSAVARFNEALAMHRELDNPSSMAPCLVNLVPLTLEAGDAVTARAQLVECLRIVSKTGSRYVGAWALEAAGLCAAQAAGGTSDPSQAQEKLQQAARLYGAGNALRKAIESPLRRKDLDVQLERLSSLRSALGDDAFNAAWTEGQLLTFEEAIVQALRG